jgi:hypothetical protein
MSLDIGSALSRGFDRTIKKNGLILIGLFAVLNVLQSVVSASIFQQFVENIYDQLLADASSQEARDAIREAQGQLGDAFPLAFLDGVPVGALAVGWVALALVGLVLNIGAIRTFVSDQTERLPSENFTRRFLWTVLNLIAGFILYGIIVAIGFVFLVIPGIFFAVALFFYNYEIIVNEKNAIEALSRSWDLTSGNRLLLFALGFIFLLLGQLIGFVVGIFLPGTSAVGSVLSTLVSTVVTVFGIATAAQAYNQLRQDGDTGVPDPTVGAGPGHGQGPQGRQPSQGPGQQGGPRGGQQGRQGGQPGQGPGQQGGQRGGRNQNRDDGY